MSESARTTRVEGDQTASAMAAWIGRIAAPLLALIVYALTGLDDSLSPAARATAAVGMLMAVLWMTEALPLSVTSLLPIVLFPATGALTVRAAAAPFADPVIFLFMGGFMLALAMERWGLHRRIALITVLLVGTRPRALIGGFMLATGLLSMWISNTATVVMMLPIATSIVTLAAARLEAAGQRDPAALKPFGICMMLGIAYAASIGGVGTPIGTPPNAVLVGFVRQSYGVSIGFADWMLVCVPFALVFGAITWAMLVFVTYPVRLDRLPGGREVISDELRRLGRMSRGEWTVLIVFTLTATAWIVRQPLAEWGWLEQVAPWLTSLLGRIDDTVIAIGAGVLLFAIPVSAKRGVFALDWATAARLPWGVLLLFGGGLSLAGAVVSSGLDNWIGAQVGELRWLPTIALVVAVVSTMVYLGELTSNTAAATTFLPILGGVAVGLDVAHTTLLIPAAIAASCSFMLPVGTPPNAIVFGSGYLTIGQMVKAGFWLNLIGIALITLLAFTLIPWIFAGLLEGAPA